MSEFKLNDVMRKASDDMKKLIQEGDPHLKGVAKMHEEKVIVRTRQRHLDENSVMRSPGPGGEYETSLSLAFERVSRGLVELVGETKMAEPEEAEVSAPVESKKKGIKK